ncbi:hypothetical protein GCM10010406_55560 [Streptomyces thermolineatus]|uniref:Uncharacterized protein n=1 Tax=Streptomyces thermolineatus TaxID=44033 RepID=A0ABN3N3R7_9ACTN
MGSLQNAGSVNFTHVLDEQAVHAASLVAAAFHDLLRRWREERPRPRPDTPSRQYDAVLPARR